MVGGSIFPTVRLSFCQCLSLSFPASFPHHFFVRCQQATRCRENPGRQAGSRVRAQGQQRLPARGQAVTECSVLERQDWSGAKVADHETGHPGRLSAGCRRSGPPPSSSVESSQEGVCVEGWTAEGQNGSLWDRALWPEQEAPAYLPGLLHTLTN